MNINMNNIDEKKESGFTLLELLIVVSIIAILSVALVFVLNPAETLKKSRDAQRISDIATLKTAIALYVTSTSTPYLGASTAGALNNTRCKATPTAQSTTIFYSVPTSQATISGIVDGSGGTTAVATQLATASAAAATDGSGWIPVMFDNLTGGSPISNLPFDPLNNATTTPGLATYAYRYACSITPLAFEINAVLESDAYTVSDDKRASDGGNNTSFYEVGTNLKIIGNLTTF